MEHFDGELRVLSPHNNYWYWADTAAEPEMVIVLRGAEALAPRFEEVEVAGEVRCRFCREKYNAPGYVVRGPRASLGELWPALKSFTRCPSLRRAPGARPAPDGIHRAHQPRRRQAHRYYPA